MSQPESDSPEAEIRADIEQTRAQLADTVDALTDKFDVKSRATEKVADVRAKVDPYKTQILIAALAGIVALVAVRKWRGR